MADRVLTLRELNRMTLARQLLLDREKLLVPAAVERLAGLQAQVPNPPYIGLWTRLRDFRRDDLTRLLERRQIVRATLMRSTLHLMTAEDYLLLRPALQPALTRSFQSIAGRRRLEGLDVARLVAVARTYFEEEPRTFAELRPVLSALEPDRDPGILAYAVRTHLPLVQVPSGGAWGYSGNAPFTTAESWLGRRLSGSENPRDLVLRYLAAFGPAMVKDVQAWSGLVRLKDRIQEFKPELRAFRDERGNELLDLPDAPLPPADTPAPVRFVPDYDNLILSHADRRRVIADEYRSKVFLSAARVRATFLVDGFVRGAWKIERARGTAALVIEPFETLSREARLALLEEGERLVRFAGEDAEAFEVRFAEKV
ncbi:MAG: winged helix DNA-binding domain-containing protein [Rubrobacteraceae bacterium]|nr:winged helix DNA-binding domain-containing protein [Rubrobacteraceae bacterium]